MSASCEEHFQILHMLKLNFICLNNFMLPFSYIKQTLTKKNINFDDVIEEFKKSGSICPSSNFINIFKKI